MKGLTTLIVVVVVLLILLKASAFTVNEAEQVIITQFGKPKLPVKKDPGLYFKTPFIQEVHRLEKRLLPWDGDPENMTTKDKKTIFIDVWARWRIVDPLKFYQTCKTISRGQGILDELVDSGVRDVVASHNLIECVRSTNDPLRYESEELEADRERAQERIAIGRSKLEEQMLTSVKETDLKVTYGMEVTDVHIKRVNYIENVRNRVYERMKSERTRIAMLFESEAEEERNRILGYTRKELDEIEGEREQRSSEIKGAADAEVIAIYAEALSQDPDFYEFVRQLEAYKNTLRSKTRLILSTDNEFLRRLRGAEIGPEG